MVGRLELEGLASSAVDGALGLAAADKSVLVGDVLAGHGTSGSVGSSTTQGDVLGGDLASGLGVDRGKSSLGLLEGGGLDKDVGTHARVDTSGTNVKVVVVEDVDGAESDRGGTRVDVVPVVVGVGDVELASVLLGVAVRVADKRGLVVVVEEGVGDGDEVGGVGDVEETIVEVLAVVLVGGEIAVVDPDVLGSLDADGVTAAGLDVLDDQVADNDVGLLVDVQTDTVEGGTGSTDDGLVRLDPDLSSARDGALDVDDLLASGLSGRAELGKGGDGGHRAAVSTGGAAVLSGVTNVAGLGDGGTLGEDVASLILDGGGGNGADERDEVENAEELHLDG